MGDSRIWAYPEQRKLEKFFAVPAKAFFFCLSAAQTVSDQDHHLYYEKTIPDLPSTLESDGVPFLIAGKRIYQCHQGERRKKPKEPSVSIRIHNYIL